MSRMSIVRRALPSTLAIVLLLAGCAGDPNEPATSSTTIGASAYIRGNLATLTYRAVDLMLAQAPQITASTPLLVSSITSTENVQASSPLGNIVSEMIRTRLVQDGHTSIELRLRREVAFKPDGEFLLGRTPRTLLPPSPIGAVVTGTYAVGVDNVYVSLKLVSATDAHILAGADFVISNRQAIGMLP
jgi:FlgO protein